MSMMAAKHLDSMELSCGTSALATLSHSPASPAGACRIYQRAKVFLTCLPLWVLFAHPVVVFSLDFLHPSNWVKFMLTFVLQKKQFPSLFVCVCVAVVSIKLEKLGDNPQADWSTKGKWRGSNPVRSKMWLRPVPGGHGRHSSCPSLPFSLSGIRATSFL